MQTMVNRNGDWYFTDGWNQVWRLAITGRPDYPFDIIKQDMLVRDETTPNCANCSHGGSLHQPRCTVPGCACHKFAKAGPRRTLDLELLEL